MSMTPDITPTHHGENNSSWQHATQCIGAGLAWLAVGCQFYLMLINRTADVPETILRFFSFFTILTNLLVAIYFTSLAFFAGSKVSRFFVRPGRGTAVTAYILLVGLGYQFLLRHIWDPQGLQWMTDEMLHSVIPLYTLLYWVFFVPRMSIKFKSILSFLVYPLFYFLCILVRGAFSGFYPYPFIDVTQLGYGRVLLHSLGLLIVFLILSVILMMIPKPTTLHRPDERIQQT